MALGGARDKGARIQGCRMVGEDVEGGAVRS